MGRNSTVPNNEPFKKKTWFAKATYIFMAKKNESYGELVIKAVLNIKDYRKGASRPAIKKYIESNHKKVMNPASLRVALAKAVASGDLLQEGQRFKLPKEKRAELRKPAPKPKKKKVKITQNKT